MNIKLSIFPDRGHKEDVEFGSYKELFDYAAKRAEQEYKDSDPDNELRKDIPVEPQDTQEVPRVEDGEPVVEESKPDEPEFPTREGFFKKLLG